MPIANWTRRLLGQDWWTAAGSGHDCSRRRVGLFDWGPTDLLEWFGQLEFYKPLSLLRVAFTIRNPRAAAHPGGIWELGDANACLIESAKIVIGCDSQIENSNIDYRLQASGQWESAKQLQLEQLGSGGEHFQSRIHRNANGKVHAPMRGAKVSVDGQVREFDRLTPQLIVSHSDDALGLYVPRFWENFPKSLSAKNGEIELGLFPESFGEPIELQPGEQKTHEFWLATGNIEDVKSALDSTPPNFTRVDPDWICQTGVIHG